jgi:thiol-disulfide isomerase/thioredoxin
VKTAHHPLHIPLTALLLSLSFACQSADWQLKDKDGVRYTSAELQGRWVLVNFWAPWCPTCLQEIPELDALQAKHKDVQVIGVAVMYKNRKEVMEIVRNQAVNYPVVFGSEDTAADFGGMPGLPTSFLYSPSGKLVGRHSGPLTQQEIEQAIEQGSKALFSL